MKILALNFSPKGEYSTTIHSVYYMEASNKSVKLRTHHIGKRIHIFIKKPERIKDIVEDVRWCDIVLFVYPVYTFGVPYQMMKFIELIQENNFTEEFKNKYASQVLTSKHFYDSTAIEWTELITNDLGMKVLTPCSSDMDDLKTESGQKILRDFTKELIHSINYNYSGRLFKEHLNKIDKYKYIHEEIELKTYDKDILILTDVTPNENNLVAMINEYRNNLKVKSRIINLNDIRMDGGCLGCLECALKEDCKYKDGFQNLLRDEIQTADTLICAFTIHNHFTKSIFKCYDDRNFCNGHRTVEMYKPIGYIISGNLSLEPLCKNMIEWRADVGRKYLLNIVCDEYDNETISKSINDLASQTIWALEEKPHRHQTFNGIGGMKIFRDLIYKMRGLMRQDHKFYKKNGFYDFPQKDIKSAFLMYLVALLLKLPFSAKSSNSIKEGMIKSYKQVVEKAKKKYN